MQRNTRQVVVRPGESTLAFYTAHNLSSEPIVGVSTYNVTPQARRPAAVPPPSHRHPAAVPPVQ